MKNILTMLYALPRPAKQLVLLLADAVALPLIFWFVHVLRLGKLALPADAEMPSWWVWLALAGVGVLYAAGVYRAVVRAFDEQFLHKVLTAVMVMVLSLVLVQMLGLVSMPRSVPFMFGFFMFLWVWSTRSGIRWLVHHFLDVRSSVSRVAIYGAGKAGRQLLAALRASHEYEAVAFFDDDKGLTGATVMGLRVYPGSDFECLHERLRIAEVLIALPSATRSRRKEVITRLEPFRVRVRALPGVTQLVGGEVTLSDIHEVDIADLLGRDCVPPEPSLLQQDIAGKVVMVTGAGGSIGSELCRQILQAGPAKLVLFELSEPALYAIDMELRKVAGQVPLLPVLGSVQKEARLTALMRDLGVQTVYHAAAYKHVPLVEWNPFEGILNNALGTWRTARAAVQAGVETFVLISTDKAVRPTNVMGASKRLAEMGLQALAADTSVSTRFCMVRFGNVLGSSGSVVPLFRKQIAEGGPVTVTHPEITRFFMTIPEASQLVIQAGAMGTGGDVFVLDMGEPVKIVDLAARMIRLSGLEVREAGSSSGDIEITFTGLRPGEKLYEELLIGDNVYGTQHPRIMRAMEKFLPSAEYEALMEQLHQLARSYDVAGLKALLVQVVDGYQPDLSEAAMQPGASSPCDSGSATDAAKVVPIRA